jgi:hypothetical protein
MENKMNFSFGQLTSNDNGKTSASGTMGIYVTLIGGICFLLGCIDKMWLSKDIDIITQSIIFTTTGVTLLGIRKVKSIKSKNETEDIKSS